MLSRRRGWLVVPIVVSSLVVAACGGHDGLGAPAEAAAERPAGKGDRAEGWTVLQYSIADTDLEPFMIRDVAEMGAVDASGDDGDKGDDDGDDGDDLDMVALVDRAAGYSDAGVLGLDDWQGARVLELGDGRAEVLDDLGGVNTGDPAVLADFIATAIDRYPSEHYALIISDHGASWPGVGGDRSALSDPLDLGEIRSAIGTGLDRAGVDRLDLLGFDACLMATYEVASNLAPVADRMVASEELEPGHGWDYGALQEVADHPDADADDLGHAIVDGFGGQAEDEGTDSEITLSLLDLTRMAALDDAMRSFSETLTDHVADVAPVVGHERARALAFGRSPDPAQDTHMADLGRLAQDIGDRSDAVSDEADAVVDALDDVVVGSVEGEATSDATGLSIYFPPQPELFSPAYGAVDPDGAWSAFLTRYYETGSSIPEADRPQFTNRGGKADASFDDEGVHLRGTFDPDAEDNLAGATIGYGLDEADGSITLLGEEPASLGDAGSGEVTGDYDLTALTLTDGRETAFGYLQLSVDEDQGLATIEVPLSYYASSAAVATDDSQDVLLSLTLDDDGRIVEETYYAFDESLGSYGQLVPSRRGMIFPLVPSIGRDGSQGWTATTTLGLHADLDDLTYELAPVPSGTDLYAHLALTDYGDNTATLPTHLRVP
jgi:hypothetical protein